MDYIPICIIQYIFDFMDLITQINFRKTCKKYYKKLYIKYLIEEPYIYNITDSVLQQKCYINLIELNVSSNKNIKNIQHLNNLNKLNAHGDCGISDDLHTSFEVCSPITLKGNENIKSLNLIELRAWDNNKIKNNQHMNKLKILDCYGNCGISDDNIKSLNLIALYAKHNNKITNRYI